jgi:hypothetical protein
MKVIPPIEITSVTSSTVPEEVAATYNAGATYAIGDLVGLASKYGDPQTVWRSKQNGNTGQALADGVWWQNAGIVYPVYNSGSSCGIGGIVTDLANHDLYESLVVGNTGNALSDTTKWKYIGKTNRFRLFDYSRNNRTSVPLEFTVVFAPGKRIDSICLDGILANSYSLSVSSAAGGGVVYTSSGSLNTRIVRTWYEHLTVPFTKQPSLFFFDVPPFSDCVVTLTLTSTSGNAELAALGVGRFVYLGKTQYGAVSDILNFSTVERDSDGNAIMTKRRNIPKSRQTVFSDKGDVDKIMETRDLLNAETAFWYGIDDATDGYFESVSMLGFYRDFQINVSFPENAVVTFELEKV